MGPNMQRRHLLKAGAGVAAMAGAPWVGAQSPRRVVVIGGGFGGATAARYLRHLSCPRMMDDVAGRVARVVESVRDWSADAVVLEKLEFCSMMSGESYILSRELAKARIPCLALTRELYGGGTGQLKTRLQAFCEQVRGRP